MELIKYKGGYNLEGLAKGCLSVKDMDNFLKSSINNIEFFKEL
jgi:hypothetical protein